MEAVTAAGEPATGMPRLEVIFRQNYALVFGAAYRVTGNASDAEDVLQTVFLRLLQRIGQPPPENLAAYLHRAAVNAALDILKTRHNAPRISIEDLRRDLPGNSSQSPDRVYAAGEIREWLRMAVARLSPAAAEMFALRFLEGKSNPEIARMVGTSEGTVAVTLSRARDRIETEFRSYMGGE